jgi:hypothetical protein
MARYEHLPIYKQAMDVAVYFERAVAGFSRYHKYTLGTELRNHSREIVGLIVRANSAEDKRPALLALRERLDALLVSMRIAKEVQAFKSFAAYQQAVEAVVSICRQNEGWLKSLGAKGDAQARGPESARRKTPAERA